MKSAEHAVLDPQRAAASVWGCVRTHAASLLGLILPVVAFEPVVALAQDALPPASSVVRVDLLGDDNRVEGGAPSTLQLSNSFSSSLFEAQANGRAETFGGAMPAATAEVEVSARRLQDWGNGIFEGSASSALRYWMQIRPRRQAPITFQPQLRVHARIIGEASVMHGGAGGGGAVATAIAAVGPRAANAQAHTSGKLSDGFDESFAFAVTPLEPIMLTVSASTTASVGNPSDGFATAIAVADPELSFDEEAFAAYLAARGIHPFLQSDYYDFEYSSGILVPEANSPTMLSVGILAVALMHLFRIRVRCVKT